MSHEDGWDGLSGPLPIGPKAVSRNGSHVQQLTRILRNAVGSPQVSQATHTHTYCACMGLFQFSKSWEETVKT